jgi:hypothetical protein
VNFTGVHTSDENRELPAGTLASVKLISTAASYSLVSVEVAFDIAACMFDADTIPECSFTIQLSASVLATAVSPALTQTVTPGVATGAEAMQKAVWSQLLRVRVLPRASPPTSWPEVSFGRQGSYHIDVVTFHFDSAVVPALAVPSGDDGDDQRTPREFLKVTVLFSSTIDKSLSPLDCLRTIHSFQLSWGFC